MNPYDPHVWWIFDARVTSPRTCPVCLALDGTKYRGDELANAFPYHVVLNVNTVKPMVHPHCRCRLRWAGRSKDVLVSPYGMRNPKRKLPELPYQYTAGRRLKPLTPQKLSPSQHFKWINITRWARECYTACSKKR